MRGWPGSRADSSRGTGTLCGEGGAEQPLLLAGLSSGGSARERSAPGGLRESRESMRNLEQAEAETSISVRTQVSFFGQMMSRNITKHQTSSGRKYDAKLTVLVHSDVILKLDKN